jgi:hypothetical protein
MRTRTRDEVVDESTADPYAPVVRDRATYSTMRWSPAQVIGLVIGIGAVVLGIAAVNKTGSPHLYTPHATVWHLGFSPLLGWSTIAFGGLLILASVVPGAARSVMALLGAIAVALGIVIVVDAAPRRLHHWLGVTHNNGWVYIVGGAVLVLAAMLSPVFFADRRRERAEPVRVVRS